MATGLGLEANISLFVLSPSTDSTAMQWAFSAGDVEREVYRAGDQHHLKRGEAKQYRMDDACWALEYARGNIPSM
jgi:C-8 sterol isomerase